MRSGWRTTGCRPEESIYEQLVEAALLQNSGHPGTAQYREAVGELWASSPDDQDHGVAAGAAGIAGVAGGKRALSRPEAALGTRRAILVAESRGWNDRRN